MYSITLTVDSTYKQTTFTLLVYRTNGSILCPFVWPSNASESVEKILSSVTDLWPLFLDSFFKIRDRMEAILKGIVLDHWSTVI